MKHDDFTHEAYDKFKDESTRDRTTGRTKTVDEIFATRVNPAFLPTNITVRESCDSELFPESTAIGIGLDGTGSMHGIPHALITDGLGRMMKKIYDEKPVTDPQIM